MILDTRTDLIEARALYARLGYTETERHNEDPYAEHWFTKDLSPASVPSRPAAARARSRTARR